MTGRLPDTFIVGEMKCGTTAVADYLGGHPEVFLAPGKEIHFFNKAAEWAKGMEWYTGLFAGATTEKRLVDGTPSTMFYAHAVERLAATVPDARLIVMLRHPVERTWSHYNHEQVLGTDVGTFEEAVERELATPQEPHLLARSRYVHQLDRLMQYFRPEQMLVVLLDDLEAGPHKTWDRICGFLDIDASYAPPNLSETVNPTAEIRARWLFNTLYRFRLWRAMPRRTAVRLHNALLRPAPREPMPAAMRPRLIEVFREDNQALAERLGRDLSAWDR